jgi:predicted alpha/beta-hydrolase family hydrolase
LKLESDLGDAVTARLAMPREARGTGVVLAHGAGAGQDHPWMVLVRDALAAAGLPTMTFNYAYTEAGRGRPDRPDRLLAIHAAATQRMCGYTDRIVLAGKSMGGRMASHLVGDRGVATAGLVYFGYPLVALGKTEPRAWDHLQRIDAPQLFFAGTRDRLSPPDILAGIVPVLPEATLVVVDDADHSFRVPARTGRTSEEVLLDLVDQTSRWIADNDPTMTYAGGGQ